MAQCGAGVPAMTAGAPKGDDDGLRIADSAERGRDELDTILDESFEGRYLWHAKKTLAEIETVRVAYIGETPVGLAMLKVVRAGAGYVYYIAVGAAHRKEGIGTRLLEDSLRYFAGIGAKEVYASVGSDNVESNALFRGHGFRK